MKLEIKIVKDGKELMNDVWKNLPENAIKIARSHLDKLEQELNEGF